MDENPKYVSANLTIFASFRAWRSFVIRSPCGTPSLHCRNMFNVPLEVMFPKLLLHFVNEITSSILNPNFFPRTSTKSSFGMDLAMFLKASSKPFSACVRLD